MSKTVKIGLIGAGRISELHRENRSVLLSEVD